MRGWEKLATALETIKKMTFRRPLQKLKSRQLFPVPSMSLLAKLLHHYVFDLIILFCFFLDIFVVRKPSFNYEFLIFRFIVYFFVKGFPEIRIFFICFDLSKFLYLRITFALLQFLFFRFTSKFF